MNSARVVTQTDRKMEDAMLAFAGDSERVQVLEVARAFKRSWLDLAEALTRVYDQGNWERWGFESFEAYCRLELHIKKNTVAKLLGSYRFLETNAPKVLRRTADEPAAPLPSLQAVDFVKRAAKRGAADSETMREIQVAAFEEGVEAPLLTKRFREVAFPVGESEKKKRLKSQLISAARRLAGLIAEPESPLPHEVAASVEEAVGQLLTTLEAA